MKLREVRAILRGAGYEVKRQRGSHETWMHPDLPNVAVVLAGNDGEDAHKYQVARARKVVRPVAGKLPSRQRRFHRGMMVYES